MPELRWWLTLLRWLLALLEIRDFEVAFCIVCESSRLPDTQERTHPVRDVSKMILGIQSLCLLLILHVWVVPIWHLVLFDI